MKNSFLKIAAIIFFILTFFISVEKIMAANQEEELKIKIEERNKELQKIKEEIESTEKDLNKVENQKRTYQGDVNSLTKNIKQLNLGIKSAEVSIGKLDLELTSLETGIRSTEEEIEDKTSSMGEVLREVQFLDSSSEIMTILKSKSLSEGVTNIQNLLDLKNKISDEVEVLKSLKDDLNFKVKDRSEKKEEVVLQNKNLTYRKAIVQEQQEEKNKLLSLTKKQAEEYSEKLDDLVKKQEEIAKEIEDIETKLKESFNSDSLKGIGGVLLSPIKGAIEDFLTQGYGITSFSLNYKSGFHNGIDLGIPTGTPIFASADGVVLAVGNQDNYCYKGAYGRFIILKHSENKLTTLYAHLSKYIVSPNQTVERGELIGYSGSSGFSTGPHLHFTVYASETFYMGQSRVCGQMPFGAHLNPMEYIGK
ncbi:MAG: peptidoglycan DD-metalloendopeptidase family protein [Candidatus Pacebacteria bacterium]|nr:peptidoglycan DD-metalloendopeptidase family protein [Candidatus Paceibacterota bacterium]